MHLIIANFRENLCNRVYWSTNLFNNLQADLFYEDIKMCIHILRYGTVVNRFPLERPGFVCTTTITTQGD